jgi:hypothetical protein
MAMAMAMAMATSMPVTRPWLGAEGPTLVT